MTQTVSYCGLTCQTCPIYIATRMENDEEQAHKRGDIAKMCVQYYGKEYKAEDINDCNGCRSTTLFFGCHECQVRSCAIEKKVETCAHCKEYVCSKLEGFFAKDPGARNRLSTIRTQIQSNTGKA